MSFGRNVKNFISANVFTQFVPPINFASWNAPRESDEVGDSAASWRSVGPSVLRLQSSGSREAVGPDIHCRIFTAIMLRLTGQSIKNGRDGNVGKKAGNS